MGICMASAWHNFIWRRYGLHEMIDALAEGSEQAYEVIKSFLLCYT